MARSNEHQNLKKPTLFMAPTFFLIFLVLGAALHFLFPIIQIIIFPYRYLGILPVLFGGWLNLSADRLFKKHNTTVKPFRNATAFLRKGPFSISRHPMYLGMVMILLGEAILLGSLIAFVAPVALFVMTDVLFIPPEEKSMTAIFGNKYIDYRKKVGRWL